MAYDSWKDHVEQFSNLLKNISFRGEDGCEIGAEAGFAAWQNMTLRLRGNRGTIFLAGNGASAAMASHMAADLAKNAHLHTEVFSDLSLITAISNDMGYEFVFSEPLSRRARPADMFVAISSSGRSPNILAAVQVAAERGLDIVTLSALDGDNPLRRSGTLNIFVPATTYGGAETCHAAVLHHWMDLVEYSRS